MAAKRQRNYIVENDVPSELTVQNCDPIATGKKKKGF